MRSAASLGVKGRDPVETSTTQFRVKRASLSVPAANPGLSKKQWLRDAPRRALVQTTRAQSGAHGDDARISASSQPARRAHINVCKPGSRHRVDCHATRSMSDSLEEVNVTIFVLTQPDLILTSLITPECADGIARPHCHIIPERS